MAALGVNRRVLKLLLNPWLRRSKVKRFVTAGKLHKLIIFNLLKETKNQTETRPPTLVYALAKSRRCQSMVSDRLIAINTINNNQ